MWQRSSINLQKQKRQRLLSASRSSALRSRPLPQLPVGKQVLLNYCEAHCAV